jgi:P-type E1-E2 ATPase
MLSDKIRDGAVEMVSELSKDGFDVGMISGDCENVVREVSKVLKLKFSHFGLSPQEKASLVKRLMQPKRKMGDFEVKRVAFIGDGVNDAPAIADAHLGIAMGSGSALAQSAADVILLSNDLGQVRSTFSILGQTRSLITQNLVLSFGYNLLAIPVAAGILFPSYGILLNPMIASAAMALSSVTVLLNSIRSLRR